MFCWLIHRLREPWTSKEKFHLVILTRKCKTFTNRNPNSFRSSMNTTTTSLWMIIARSWSWVWARRMRNKWKPGTRPGMHPSRSRIRIPRKLLYNNITIRSHIRIWQLTWKSCSLFPMALLNQRSFKIIREQTWATLDDKAALTNSCEKVETKS